VFSSAYIKHTFSDHAIYGVQRAFYIKRPVVAQNMCLVTTRIFFQDKFYIIACGHNVLFSYRYTRGDAHAKRRYRYEDVCLFYSHSIQPWYTSSTSLTRFIRTVHVVYFFFYISFVLRFVCMFAIILHA